MRGNSTEQVHIKHISVSCFKYRSNFDEIMNKVDERPSGVLAEMNRSQKRRQEKGASEGKGRNFWEQRAQGVQKQVTPCVS